MTSNVSVDGTDGWGNLMRREVYSEVKLGDRELKKVCLKYAQRSQNDPHGTVRISIMELPGRETEVDRTF